MAKVYSFNTADKETTTTMTKDLVVQKEGKAITTSLMVAEVFGKLHKNVIQAIELLDCPEDFTELNFQPSGYQDSTGRHLPMYNITRDGFVLLAMGFTGKKALKFKLDYINEFNRMEEFIQSQQKPKAIDDMPEDELMARAVLIGHQKILLLESKVEELTPKAEAFEDLLDTNGMTNLQNLGKILGYQSNKLIGALRALGYLSRKRRKKAFTNEPCQEYIKKEPSSIPHVPDFHEGSPEAAGGLVQISQLLRGFRVGISVCLFWLTYSSIGDFLH